VKVSRRRLLIGAVAVAGGGLGLAVYQSRLARMQPLGEVPGTLEPNAWLQLTPDGAITLQVDRAELGQGVITGFVTLLAEELDVPPAQVRFALAPVHPLFQDPAQLTGESTSMRKRWDPLRRTGATARAMLLQAAAARWQADAAMLDTDGQGAVVDPRTGARLTYGELAAAAGELPVPADVPLRPPAGWRVIGTDVRRPDVPAKVAGSARYGIDTRLPGLLTAVIRRPPRLRAPMGRFDDAAARAVPGVVDVFPIHAGVAVVAEGFWPARTAAGRLDVEWLPGPLAGFHTADVRARQATALEAGDAGRVRDDGDVDAAFDRGGRVIAAEYHVPYLAHATLEPMNATLWFRDDGCEAWVPSQGPDMVRQVICDMTGLARAQVRVHTTLAGGGFGRRATVDYVIEAVEIARRFRQPVQLVWTREDDLAHGLYRESSLHRLRGALADDGSIAAWEHRLTSAGLNHLILPNALPVLMPGWVPPGSAAAAARWLGPRLDGWFASFNGRQGSVDQPYATPACRVGIAAWNPGVPVTIWRSVGHSFNAFVVECFIDELAAAAGDDPAEYRRRHLAGHPRRLAVLELALERAGWGRPPPGHHQGVAVHEAFGSAVAQVAEVSVDGDAIRVHRVTCAVDCGIAINPDVVRQQIEGGVLFGLSAALHGAITIEDGAVRETNFDRYRLLRLGETPEVDVHIVPSTADPGGIGEVGVPPIAPAVANAVFAATGRRLRSLPLMP
jgi:CO/xanthine dehydrogenase Mo-binding subunit